MEFLYLSMVAILFGFFQKIADGHNEHGLNWFKGAGMLFDIVCGLIGIYLITYSDILQISYLSLLLYWLFAGKIDYINHIIAFLIIIFGMFLFGNYDYQIYLYSILIGLIYLIFKLFKNKLCKNNNMKLFYSYKIHFYIIPLIFSIYFEDIFGTIVVFNILGVYLANKIFKIKKS